MRRKKIKKIEFQIKDNVEVCQTPQVLKLFGLKPETFRQWIKRGFITPHEKASGSGQTHSFTKNNLYVIGLFIHLCKTGLNRVVASHFAQEIFYDLWIESLAYEEHARLIIKLPDNPEKKRKRLRDFEAYVETRKFIDLGELRWAFILDVKKIIEDIDSKLS